MPKTAIMLALALPLVLPGVAAAQTLPANLEVPVTLASEISSQRMKAGEMFDVAVARDVWVDGRVVIPRGTRGQGAVTWRTGKGAFGKSGKMEIEVRSIDLAGVAVPLTGKYREEGQGNTGATIGTIAVAGLVGGAFVTGHSAVFEAGRELRAFTTQPVALAGGAPVMVAVAAPVSPTPAAAAPVFAAVVAAPVVTAQVVAVPAIVPPVAPPAVVASPAPAFLSRPALATPVVAQPAVFVAPRPYAALTFVPATMPEATVRATAAEDSYDRLLKAQQGVRGRSAQGWTISD